MPILYRHIRVDTNMPFYIGIGKKINRAYCLNRNQIWKRITQKTDYIVEILYEDSDINIIKKKEQEFIKLYGRIDKKNGTLANLTDGGELNNGRIVSEKTRSLLRGYCGEKAHFWGKKHTEQVKRLISLKTKNTKSKGISEETLLKMSNAQRKRTNRRSGYTLSEESKANISLGRMGKPSYNPNELQKAQRSIKMKQYWADNEHKKRFGNENVSRKEEVREKLRKSSGGENNAMYGKTAELNPMYGKTHSLSSLEKMSNSRKGKCMGEDNPSKREDVKQKIREKKIEYWKNKKNQINEKRME